MRYGEWVAGVWKDVCRAEWVRSVKQGSTMVWMCGNAVRGGEWLRFWRMSRERVANSWNGDHSTSGREVWDGVSGDLLMDRQIVSLTPSIRVCCYGYLQRHRSNPNSKILVYLSSRVWNLLSRSVAVNTAFSLRVHTKLVQALRELLLDPYSV